MLRKFFGHAVYTEETSDLGLIRSCSEVNLVAVRMPVRQETQDYLDAFNIENDLNSIRLDQSINPETNDIIKRPYKTLFSLHFNADTPPSVEAVIDKEMRLMPQRNGIDVFASEMIHHTKIFSQAVGKKNIATVLYVNFPSDMAPWHGDIRTDIRGLRIWKGMTTLWRSQDTIDDWTRLSPNHHDFGFHGCPNSLSPDQIYQGPYNAIPENHLSIWKGQLHGQKALVHAEPVQQDSPQPRLIQAFHII